MTRLLVISLALLPAFAAVGAAVPAEEMARTSCGSTPYSSGTLPGFLSWDVSRITCAAGKRVLTAAVPVVSRSASGSGRVSGYRCTMRSGEAVAVVVCRGSRGRVAVGRFE